MALQQPTTRPAVQRVARPATVGDSDIAASERPVEESQTWVLFSPPTDATTASYLGGTVHSLDTPGRSQLSDVGSLHTAQRTDARLSTTADDDAELDSLDSHLPEFRSLSGSGAQPLSLPLFDSQRAAPVLPGHDGLGSFRLDRPALGSEAQDHIYQFERFNPRRVRRRLDSLEPAHGQNQEEEKRLRIEAWRLEHSRTLLDEVQRETRRRRKSQASMHGLQRSADAESDKMTWHDEDAVATEPPADGFLARVTRKVVKDLLGIDEKLLSVLLGESSLDEHHASTTGAGGLLSERAQESSWQLRMLERLSRELGLLAKHLSRHPGAFSTWTRMQQMALPYAGLPVIPERADAAQAAEASMDPEPEGRSQASAPEFRPTMHQHAPAAGTAGRRADDDARDAGGDYDAATDRTFTKDEWERSLDAKLVLRYLVSRFTSRSKTPAAAGGGSRGAGTPTAQDSAAKMTRVRQQHPLIAPSRAAERRSLRAALPASPAAPRHHSSCASQSTRRSARRSSCSSRRYWDICGSLGTGSMVGAAGPMGSWGEV